MVKLEIQQHCMVLRYISRGRAIALAEAYSLNRHHFTRGIYSHTGSDLVSLELPLTEEWLGYVAEHFPEA